LARILVVSAAPDPDAFTAAWAGATVRAGRDLGHEVALDDLVAEGFDPVESPRHYPGWQGRFDPLIAQETGGQDSDVQTRIAQVRAADWVVFHFPVWWFGPPAILKGWCDRVLAHGQLHDVDHRFDAGMCRGKRALFCVSTGASAEECGPDGKEGNLRLLLWPLAYALRYCGFDVAEPATVHGVHGYWEGAERAALEARLQATLGGQRDLLDGLADRPLWPFNADTDFDATGRLRPDAPEHWPFIKRG
jgi:NAD(P)H dehydrogenase (quinone)